MNFNEYQLSIELVPQTSWYTNLRNMMSRENWDKVRKAAYWEHGYRCAVCGVTGVQLYCHELWEYDDENHVQSLKGFTAICPLCHHVKHIGLAGILASEGKLDLNAVVEHFMYVNDCSRVDFEQHRHVAFSVWESRSRHPWTVDLGEYAALVEDSGDSSVDRRFNWVVQKRIQTLKDDMKP